MTFIFDLMLVALIAAFAWLFITYEPAPQIQPVSAVYYDL